MLLVILPLLAHRCRAHLFQHVFLHQARHDRMDAQVPFLIACLRLASPHAKRLPFANVRICRPLDMCLGHNKQEVVTGEGVDPPTFSM